MLTLVFIMTGPPVGNNLTICIMSDFSVYIKAFGFLGGEEVFEEKVGNLGLWDRKHSALPVRLGRLMTSLQNALLWAGLKSILSHLVGTARRL
jgi:hypothetical protein